MKRITELILFSVCVILFAAFPAAGAEKVILLDECKYASAESARAQWKPVEKDGAPVGVGTVGGKAALKLPYNFGGNDRWNIAWQREGSWDLSDCRRIVMDVTTDRQPGDVYADNAPERRWVVLVLLAVRPAGHEHHHHAARGVWHVPGQGQARRMG